MLVEYLIFLKNFFSNFFHIDASGLPHQGVNAQNLEVHLVVQPSSGSMISLALKKRPIVITLEKGKGATSPA